MVVKGVHSTGKCIDAACKMNRRVLLIAAPFILEAVPDTHPHPQLQHTEISPLPAAVAQCGHLHPGCPASSGCTAAVQQQVWGCQPAAESRGSQTGSGKSQRTAPCTENITQKHTTHSCVSRLGHLWLRLKHVGRLWYMHDSATNAAAPPAAWCYLLRPASRAPRCPPPQKHLILQHPHLCVLSCGWLLCMPYSPASGWMRFLSAMSRRR